MFSDSSCSVIFEEKWDYETRNLNVELVTQYIIIGKQGVALSVQPNSFISEWYNVPESAPHITLLVNEQFESKDLGPVMQVATQTEWQETENFMKFFFFFAQ